jgi:hypothetical protein
MASYFDGVLIADRPKMSAIIENPDENTPRPKDFSNYSIDSNNQQTIYYV